jgi:hypothetical protein
MPKFHDIETKQKGLAMKVETIVETEEKEEE